MPRETIVDAEGRPIDRSVVVGGYGSLGVKKLAAGDYILVDDPYSRNGQKLDM